MTQRFRSTAAWLALALAAAAPAARAETATGEPTGPGATPARVSEPVSEPAAGPGPGAATGAATGAAPPALEPSASGAPAATPVPAVAPVAPPSAGPAPAAAPASLPSAEARRARFRAIAREAAARHGLPFEMADAVMRVESAYNAGARGRDGEVGLMQVMPPTARLLGFSGTLEELAQPEVNIALGVRYLGDAWRLAKGDICTAAMKYRAGHGETRFSVLSVDYCVRVRTHLASLGYPVTGEVPKATFGFEARIGRGKGQVQWGFGLGSVAATKRLYAGRKLKSRAAWSAHDARMNALTARGRAFTGLR